MECEREPDIYESTRLIFGARASPFLAQKVLLHHAESNEDNFPVAARILKEETYVDDVMTCLETEEEAKEAREELTQLLGKGGFSIRRWCSNRLSPLDGVPEEDKVTISPDSSGLPITKILGIQWDAQADQFMYNVTSPKKVVYTKRGVLSKVCTIFDPIGFLAPFTIRAKIGIQRCWQEGIGWDEAMPADLEKAWRDWFQEVEELRQISVQRCLRQDRHDTHDVSLHTFTDASEKAFGAVTYIRYVFSDGSVEVTFVAAKTRVSPLSATSIPRLELMGAHLGVRLSQKLAVSLEIPIEKHNFWTDSMNVLSWIKSESRQFKPFVANRVASIQQETCPSQWRHVPGEHNPADDASRGLSADQLTSDSRWFTGPEFLNQDPASWPERPLAVSTPEANKEKKKVKLSFPAQHHQVVWNENKFSSLKRLIRITAWVIRFTSNCRSGLDKRSGILTPEELREAEKYWIKVTQQRAFQKEMTALQGGQGIHQSSSIISLMPQLAEGGMLRVTGRLQSADIADEAKYPIILPQKSHFTQLVIQDTHERLKHAGVNHVLAETRQRFWIVNGRQAVKSWDFRCSYCRRRRASPGEQVMAPLPDCRLGHDMRAFACCGVDFAGPYLTKVTSRTTAKRYLCLFTCMSTRAVHLEMAADLTADAFLLAFSRMVARRGRPKMVLSDNGRNFLGAKMELRRIEEAAPEIARKLGQEGVVWKLNPPSAPHHGGVFESMIKSAKKALSVVLGQASVTDDELATAFTEVEGILNSRPLTYCGADPKDEPCLTPNHFLIGQMGGNLLTPQMTEQSARALRRRWRHLQDLVSKIWRRFRRELLPTLSQRHKWQEVKRDVEVGDVMLLLEPSTPRGKWPLVVVDDVYTGQDGHVRVVDVRRNGQVFRRPITKLCPLEFYGEGS